MRQGNNIVEPAPSSRLKASIINILMVWPTIWTPAVGGLFVYLCVRGHVSLCVRGHVAILFGA